MTELTQKMISVKVDELNSFKNIVDITGDIISYENLKESIRNNGVQEPILIDKKKRVISGNRRVQISKELNIETIPAIIVDSNISELDIEKLRVELLTTNRNISYLDIVQIYCHQDSVFEKYNEPYSEYMCKIKDCSQRDVQLKMRIGKAYKAAPNEIKDIFQKIDSKKKIPLKTLKLLPELKDVDLNNFFKDIMNVEKEITHKHIVTVTKEYTEMLNRIKRIQKNDEELKKAKDSKDEKFGDDELNELNSLSKDSKDNEPEMVLDIKKVFKYQIKKHFKVKIDTVEERDVRVIQSKMDIDFKEEIELIKSLLEGVK